ncbi:hypothetical protein [Glycomyces rhizosphaerae]|uniref:MFS transporter n=1 Tax=Glycomyces rhizosphaerae TaxID=2054422 RepID=A0ABV7Q1I4_9ACTN
MTSTETTAAPEAATTTRWRAILAVGFAQLVVAGGMSTLAVALPAIRTDFHVTEAATAWVLLSYALPMGPWRSPPGGSPTAPTCAPSPSSPWGR